MRIAYSFFLCCLLSLSGFGQVVEGVEEFESESGTPLQLGYIQTVSLEDLVSLKSRLPANAFPLIVVKRGDFAQKVGLIRRLQARSQEYGLLSRELAYVDSLNTLQDQAFEEILKLERQRADLHKRTNEQLNAEITRLSVQIDKTIDIGEKSLKGRNFKHLTIGILGGAIGLTTGLLVGVLVNRGK